MIDELNAAVLEAYAPVCPSCGKRYPECRDMRPVNYLPDAAAVEDEIARRGLQDAYIAALTALNPTSEWLEDERWFFLRATPEQRCRAALAAAAQQETR